MTKSAESTEKNSAEVAGKSRSGTESFVGLAGVVVTLVSGTIMLYGFAMAVSFVDPELSGRERWRAILGGLFDSPNRFGAIVTVCIFTAGLCFLAMGILGRQRVRGWRAFLFWLAITILPLVVVFLFLSGSSE